MKKDKVQEISAWDEMESTWPDSSLGREGTSIASLGMALGKAPLGRPVRGGLLRGPGLVLCMYQMFLVHPNIFLETKNVGQTHMRHQRVKGL